MISYVKNKMLTKFPLNGEKLHDTGCTLPNFTSRYISSMKNQWVEKNKFHEYGKRLMPRLTQSVFFSIERRGRISSRRKETHVLMLGSEPSRDIWRYSRYFCLFSGSAVSLRAIPLSPKNILRLAKRDFHRSKNFHLICISSHFFSHKKNLKFKTARIFPRNKKILNYLEKIDIIVELNHRNSWNEKYK